MIRKWSDPITQDGILWPLLLGLPAFFLCLLTTQTNGCFILNYFAYYMINFLFIRMTLNVCSNIFSSWVVVLPCGSRNLKKPFKLELAMYANAQVCKILICHVVESWGCVIFVNVKTICLFVIFCSFWHYLWIISVIVLVSFIFELAPKSRSWAKLKLFWKASFWRSHQLGQISSKSKPRFQNEGADLV